MKVPVADRVMMVSGILGPLDAHACRGLVATLDMELDAFAAVAVPGAIRVLAGAILFDVRHGQKRVMQVNKR